MSGTAGTGRTRLDQLLVDRGLASSRANAQRRILAGDLYLSGTGIRTLQLGRRVKVAAAS